MNNNGTMKKLISTLLLLSMCLSFGGCAVGNNNEFDNNFLYKQKEDYKNIFDKGEPDGEELILIRSEADGVILYTEDTKKEKEYTWLNEKDWNSELPLSLNAVYTEDAKKFYGSIYSSGSWKSVELDKNESPDYIKRSFYLVADEDRCVTLNAYIEDEVLATSTKLGISFGSADEMEIYDFCPDASNPYRPISAAGAIVVKNNAGEFVPYKSDFGFGEMREQRGFDGVSLELKASEPMLVTFVIWMEGMDKDCVGSWSLDNNFKLELTIEKQ